MSEDAADTIHIESFHYITGIFICISESIVPIIIKLSSRGITIFVLKSLLLWGNNWEYGVIAVYLKSRS